MNDVKLLLYVCFGDLAPGVRFRWGRWFEGQRSIEGEAMTRMKGNRYKDAEGRTFCTGMGTAVEVIDEGREGK